MHCNLLGDIRIAKETEYDGIEIMGTKLYRYLDQGHSIESLLPYLEGLPVVGVGSVPDIERREHTEYDDLLAQCQRMCSVSEKLGSPMVQLLTGPRSPGSRMEVSDFYKKIQNLSWPELRKLTASNLKVLADIGAEYNVRFYIEPLRWAALHSLDKTLEMLDVVGRDNIGLVINFWHMFADGTTPDEIAELDQNLIMGVHFCDSLRNSGKDWTPWDRHVWTGNGVIPLKEWVDAVRATGFDGWWSCELYSPKHWELDPWKTAKSLKNQLRDLLI